MKYIKNKEVILEYLEEGTLSLSDLQTVKEWLENFVATTTVADQDKGLCGNINLDTGIYVRECVTDLCNISVPIEGGMITYRANKEKYQGKWLAERIIFAKELIDVIEPWVLEEND